MNADRSWEYADSPAWAQAEAQRRREYHERQAWLALPKAERDAIVAEREALAKTLFCTPRPTAEQQAARAAHDALFSQVYGTAAWLELRGVDVVPDFNRSSSTEHLQRCLAIARDAKAARQHS